MRPSGCRRTSVDAPPPGNSGAFFAAERAFFSPQQLSQRAAIPSRKSRFPSAISRADASASWGYAMFLDDEVAASRTRRNEARWGFYIALAALAACIVMVLGLMTQVSTQADIGQQPATAHVQSEAGRHG
jgi:hypothetical protein